MCGKIIDRRSMKLVTDGDGQTRPACPTRGCEGSELEFMPTRGPLESEQAWHEWSKILDELTDDNLLAAKSCSHRRSALAD
jgi:hypothetical protein